jgi:hypothetical protein
MLNALLVAAISVLSGLLAFVALVAISTTAELVEKGLRWLQRLGKARCRRCGCPVHSTQDYCDRHRHLGPLRGGFVRRRRPAVPPA